MKSKGNITADIVSLAIGVIAVFGSGYLFVTMLRHGSWVFIGPLWLVMLKLFMAIAVFDFTDWLYRFGRNMIAAARS